jgi:hypothetical protein
VGEDVRVVLIMLLARQRKALPLADFGP